MRQPSPTLRATYRVQLHAGFTLNDATAIVPYIEALGISHLYASPVVTSRKGSRHGYDVTDPRSVNPELGGEKALRRLADALHERSMGLLVDIVPNHMSTGPENPYWEEVLTHGDRSRFAKWFDIAWDMHQDRRLVLPILRDDLRLVLERGELRLQITPDGARLEHFGTSVPLCPDRLPEILQLARLEPAAATEARRQFTGPNATNALQQLLDVQHYRLVDWRRGGRELNYRRFFDVNDLVGLRMEDEQVFDETHALTLSLVGDGVIDALRVDHIDGLRDPAGYLSRLRRELDARRDGVPVFVEKILMFGERLRHEWPVEGTTGYERLNQIDDLQVDPVGFARIEARYRRMRRQPALAFMDTVRADKRAVLDRAFAADVTRVARVLDRIVARRGDQFSREQIFHGIEEFVAWFPVYRTYVRPGDQPSAEDQAALQTVAEHGADSTDTVAGLIRAIIAGEIEVDAALRDELTGRLQQLTGPAMAKGLEDTAHYAYVPLASRNEVGGAPDRPVEKAIDLFHEMNESYAARWPQSLVATTTHDTKRSADVRARIAAISQLPEEWERSLARWRRLNRSRRTIVRGRMVPDPNTEWLLYQTLVGVWPPPRAGRRTDDVPDRSWRLQMLERLKPYFVKATREAKLRTSWTDPDQTYEGGVLAFLEAALLADEDDPFLVDLTRFASRISRLAFWSTMARTLLHLTIPGTPDIYQGDELWNQSLVDPDNRRPVDYEARRTALNGLAANDALDLERHPTPKLLVIARTLDFRRANPGLFGGAYTALSADPHAVAFARRAKDQECVVVAPRLIGQMPGDVSVGRLDGEWRCVITGNRLRARDGMLCFPSIPFGLFIRQNG
ncbi:MAG TPA: malto-oligosyltrehalose synthase [Gemmatimonadaceae bacterium]